MSNLMSYYMFINLFTNCKHCLSSTVSVRVPNEVKKKLEELDINISEAVRRHLLEIIAREERMRKLEEVDRVLRSRNLRVPEGTASSLIREERDLER